jgi:hypothetical protein
MAEVLAEIGHPSILEQDRDPVGRISDSSNPDPKETSKTQFTLFTEISRGIDKWLWFAESHSQATK